MTCHQANPVLSGVGIQKKMGVNIWIGDSSFQSLAGYQVKKRKRRSAIAKSESSKK
jgi:hypothetical protein